MNTNLPHSKMRDRRLLRFGISLVTTLLFAFPILASPVKTFADPKEKPSKEIIGIEQQVVEEPVAEEPLSEEPVVEEPVVEEPIVEVPMVEAPVVEEPVAEEPIVEVPVIEEQVPEAPLTYLTAPVVIVNKEDYNPGGKVNLKGTGWILDSAVSIEVKEVYGTWRFETVAEVDSQGMFAILFNIADYYSPNYEVAVTGADTKTIVNTSFTDDGGAYTIDFSSYNPDTYEKYFPKYYAPLPEKTIGRWPDQLGTTLHSNTRESLAPEDLVLGQIVPFEAYVTVNGSTQPENGKISMEMFWSTKTTSGSDFGYDGNYMVYAAFVDITHSTDPAGNASVTSIVNTLNTADFTSIITVEGLDNGDVISVEIWVVLQEDLPDKIAGNNDSSFVRADTASGEVITKSAQTVPLLKPSDFLAYGSLQINKSFINIPVGYVLPAYVDVDVISDYYPTFTLNIPIDSTGKGTIIKAGLVPGTYTISEVTIPEWSTTYPDGRVALVPPKGLATLNIVNTFNVPPAIRVTKTASPTHVPETGGNVIFTFLVENIGPQTVTLNSLVDDVFGDLNGKGSIVIPQTIVSGGSYTGTFTIWLSSDTLTAHTNVVTATATDDSGKETKDDDSETVTFDDVLPDISVTKVATIDTLPEPGGDFTYIIRVTNNGVEAVTLTSLSDSVFGPITIPAEKQTIPAVGYVEFEITIEHTDAGSYDNTVTAVAADNEGNSDTATATETVTVTDEMPAVDLDKSVTPPTLAEPGGTFRYKLTITNNSVESVTITALTDSNPLPAECLALIGTVLAPGASVSCEYDVIHTEAGTYPNTASVTVEDNEGNEASDTDSETVTVTDEMPAVDLDKSVTPPTLAEPGGTFRYKLTITNNSVESVTITALTDSNPLPAECLALIGTVLAPGASVSCEYDVIHTEAGTYPNTASVTVEDNEGNEASDTDSETVTVTDEMPAVDLDKSVTPPTLAEPGGTFRYKLTITNNSVENVTITALTDSNPLPAECLALIGTVLAPGASVSCEYDVIHTEAGTYPNTASVTVEDNEGNEASDTDSETVTVTDEMPAVDLDKSVTPPTLAEPGGTFRYKLTITNNSVENVTITALTDSNPLPAECLALIGTVLAPGASVSCEYDVIHTEAGTYPNTASVTVEDNEGNEASDTDSETVTVTDEMPAVDLDKSVTPPTLAEPGGTFRYKLTITNNSVESVTITALTDSNPLPAECLALIGTVLAPGASVSCEYDVIHTEAGTYPNTASVTVEDNEGNEASDTDSETVTVTDEMPAVDLDKSVTPPTLAEPGGTFRYKLTITNNSVESVTITALTDSNPLPAECLALIGTVLAPGASVSCEYDVIHTEAGTYPNTASVTVEDNEGNEASDTDSETVTVTDEMPAVDLDKSVTPPTLAEPGGTFRYKLTITNNSVESVTITALTDSNPLPAECLALIGTVLAPGASVSCEYDVIHTEAGTYPNTASVTVEDNEGNESSDTDSETVTVTDEMPAVDLDKSVTPPTLAEPGGTFRYKLTITNNSVENVTITALTDSNPLPAECLALIGTVLAPGASVSCEYDVIHTEAGTYPNTASVTVEDNEGNEASDTDSETVTVTDEMPAVDLDKSVTPPTLAEPGGTFRYKLTITNNSVESVTITALTDSNPLPAECLALIGTVLAPGASVSCEYDVIHTEAGTYPNTASVTVEDNEGNEASDTDSETVTVTDEMPAVDLDKSVTPPTLAEPGGTFRYKLTITNNSVESVTITALTDSNPLPAECLALIGTVLAPGASVSCEYDVIHTEAGTYPNTASVTVEDNEGNEASDTDSETVTVTDVLPVISVIKTADKESVPETGGVVNFTFEVTNNSVEKVMITEVNDSDFGEIYKWMYPMPEIWLAPGESITFHLNGVTISGDFESETPHENTVTASAVDNEGNPASATDTLTINFTDVTAVIDVEKEVRVSYGGESWSDWVDADDPTGPIVVEGYLVEFRFTVTNNSPVTLNNFSLTDNVYSLAGIVIPTSLESGKTVEYIIQTTAVLGQHTNTATASGSFTDGAGNVETDTDTDDANYYGISKGQPSIQIEYLMITASSVSDTASGSFRITDQSTAAKVPDGALIVLKDFGLDWTTKAKKAKVYTDIEATSCTFWVVSKEGVALDVPEQIIPNVPYIFDEEIIIEYECTFADKVLARGASLKGTAWATIYGRPDMTFTYSSTVIVQ